MSAGPGSGLDNPDGSLPAQGDSEELSARSCSLTSGLNRLELERASLEAASTLPCPAWSSWSLPPMPGRCPWCWGSSPSPWLSVGSWSSPGSAMEQGRYCQSSCAGARAQRGCSFGFLAVSLGMVFLGGFKVGLLEALPAEGAGVGSSPLHWSEL